MIAAYLLSRSFVPARCAAWLKAHMPCIKDAHHAGGLRASQRTRAWPAARTWLGRLFARWEVADRRRRSPATSAGSKRVMRHRLAVVLAAVVAAGRRGRSVLGIPAPPRVLPRGRRRRLRDVRPRPHRHAHREDRGAGSPRSRTSSASRSGDDLQLIISELGVTPDWSAAYTPNSGPMDAVVKVQLKPERPALGPGVRPPAARRASPRTRGSPTWSSPSTPAA